MRIVLGKSEWHFLRTRRWHEECERGIRGRTLHHIRVRGGRNFFGNDRQQAILTRQQLSHWLRPGMFWHVGDLCAKMPKSIMRAVFTFRSLNIHHSILWRRQLLKLARTWAIWGPSWEVSSISGLKSSTTGCYPDSTFGDAAYKVLEVLSSLPSVDKIIVHVGTNDTHKQQPQLLKSNFVHLFNTFFNRKKLGAACTYPVHSPHSATVMDVLAGNYHCTLGSPRPATSIMSPTTKILTFSGNTDNCSEMMVYIRIFAMLKRCLQTFHTRQLLIRGDFHIHCTVDLVLSYGFCLECLNLVDMLVNNHKDAVIGDANLSFDYQVKNVVQSYFFQIKIISKIRSFYKKLYVLSSVLGLIIIMHFTQVSAATPSTGWYEEQQLNVLLGQRDVITSLHLSPYTGSLLDFTLILKFYCSLLTP